ncbi:MAG: DUF2231 domain-containing protein [Microthrixaceae bacterium]
MQPTAQQRNGGIMDNDENNLTDVADETDVTDETESADEISVPHSAAEQPVDEQPEDQQPVGATDQPERSMRAAHRPAMAAAGPYGHPIHPMLVTIPIGAFVATLAFDIASVTLEGRAYGRPAVWLSLIGIVGGIIASLFGLIDYRRLTKGTRAYAVATRHLILMDVVLLCFVVGFFVRRADPDQYLNGTPTIALVLSILGVAILLVGGWLGGKLAYSYGSRVADESDQIKAHTLGASSAD